MRSKPHSIGTKIKQSLMSGLLVIIPIAILAMIFVWIVQTAVWLLKPITLWVFESDAVGFRGYFVIFCALLLICLAIGVVVRTRLGTWGYTLFDSFLSKLAPGYGMVREVVHQVIGNSTNSPLSSAKVARVRLLGADNPVEVTGFISSEHATGFYTVFVPLGLSPMTGHIYHLPKECVVILEDAGIDDAMKTVIACGAGSKALFEHSPPGKGFNG